MTGGASFTDEGTFWHREGKFMVIRGTGTITTPSAAAFSLPIPSGYTIDSSVQASTTDTNSVGVIYGLSGTVANAYPSAARGVFPAFTDTATSGTVVYFSNATNGARFGKAAGNILFASSDRFRFEVKVPIVGWDQYDIVGSFAGYTEDSKVVMAEYSTATAQSTSTGTIIDFNVKEFDSHNAVTTGAGWKFTPPFPGTYQVCSALQWAGAAYNTATFEANLLKNGTAIAASNVGWFYHSNGINMQPTINGCKNIKLLATDYIQVQSYETNGAPVNLSGTSQYNHISIHRIGPY
jgi:hypothetical protein